MTADSVTKLGSDTIPEPTAARNKERGENSEMLTIPENLMRKLFIISACATTLLFPSCVQWNLGKNVLTASVTYVGFDYRHPVDKKLYLVTEKDGTRRYYAHLPEVRYHKMPALVAMGLYDTEQYDASVVEPTGRTALAELKVDVFASQALPPRGRGVRRAPGLHGITRFVRKLPAGAEPLPPADYEYNAQQIVHSGTVEPCTEPGGTRRAVAATLSYSVDPLLTIASTTLYWVCEIPLELLSAPFCREQRNPDAEKHEP